MKLHICLKPSVDDGIDNIPQYPDQENPLGVRILFWEKYQDIPDQICWEGAVLPHVLHHHQRFLPAVQVGGSCVPIWVGLPYPPLEVFITDVCVTSGLVTLYH